MGNNIGLNALRYIKEPSSMYPLNDVDLLCTYLEGHILLLSSNRGYVGYNFLRKKMLCDNGRISSVAFGDRIGVINFFPLLVFSSISTLNN